MALVNCAECGREVSDKASSCPSCGAPVSQPPSIFSRVILVALVLVGLFFGWGFFLSMTPEGKERARDRQAYEYCLKSLEQVPGNQVARGACQQMRDQFVAKHGREP